MEKKAILDIIENFGNYLVRLAKDEKKLMKQIESRELQEAITATQTLLLEDASLKLEPDFFKEKNFGRKIGECGSSFIKFSIEKKKHRDKKDDETLEEYEKYLEKASPKTYEIILAFGVEDDPAKKRIFKTGEKSYESSAYEFIHYTDYKKTPFPTKEEQYIELEKGETFPPMKSCNKGVYWRKINRRTNDK